jgi:membrane protein
MKPSNRLKGLLASPREELSAWQATARFWLLLARRCGRNLIKDRAFQMSAALSFHTLFSLLPMLALMLVVVQAFQGIEHYRERFQSSVVEFLLPKTLVVEDGGEGAQAATEAEQDAAQLEFQRAREQLTTRIDDFLDGLSSINFGGIGVVGLLIFIYGATALLTTIEESFNLILRSRRGRPWYMRLMLYYTVITLGPLVLIAGQVAQGRFFELLASDQVATWTAWLTGPLALLTPLVTTWFVFAAMFLLLPTARLSMRAAALGSFVAAFLWLVGKALFGVYVSRTGATSLYGAIALMPLFLLWLWVTWMIILFGLEVTEALQAIASGRDDEERRRGEGEALVDPGWLVTLSAQVARAFAAGETREPGELANRLNLPRPTARLMVDVLVEAGVLRRLGEDEAGALTLARPAERVRVADILAAARAHVARQPEGEPEASASFIEALARAEQETAGEATLAELV